MPYTVTKLITNAYYISGIVSREFQTVSGSQMGDGFDVLNDILADKTVDTGMIPYYLKLREPTVIGQEEYPIENLIDVSTITFEQNNVRYRMNDVNRKKYFGSSRANNVTSYPYNYHVERNLGGATVFLYFKPSKVFEMEIWGLFRLASVTLNQDLELTVDRFYINYLKRLLAKMMCIEFGYSVPQELDKLVEATERTIDKSSAPLDLTTKKRSTLGEDGNQPNYAIANFGGWTT